MKKIVLLFLVSSFTIFSKNIKNNHIVVVTCSFNNEKICKKNLDSIFSQNYNNFDLVYVEDASSDYTWLGVKTYIKEQGYQDRVLLVHNKERKKALSNLYYNIHRSAPESIIVLVDGDDWLIDDTILAFINGQYQDGVWLTYGQFIVHPSKQLGFNSPYPAKVKEKNAFRYHGHTASHLRTFYAGLFHKIRIDDLMFQGKFFPMCYDLAIMFPMLEMGRNHFKFINKPLLVYNDENPLNDYKVSKPLQRKFDLILRARTVYRELPNLFD